MHEIRVYQNVSACKREKKFKPTTCQSLVSVELRVARPTPTCCDSTTEYTFFVNSNPMDNKIVRAIW